MIAGNVYDKYHSRNPIARYLMKGFLDSVERLVSMTAAREIHEVGCGEGLLAVALSRGDRILRGTDFSQQVIVQARQTARLSGVEIQFEVADTYSLVPESDAAELVVCCEVLEHLEEPRRALQILAGLARPYLLVSVPREPLWRALNLARGKYFRDAGNTPGHIQHWSKRGFLRMLDDYVDVVRVLSPLPWTVALCRCRG